MKTLLYSLALLALSTTAHAKELLPSGATGNDYYAACKTTAQDSPYIDGVCDGYLSGVVDTLNIRMKTPVFCVPDGVTNGQTKAIFEKYLKEHPEKRDAPIIALLAFALHDAWPSHGGKCN